MPDPDRLDELLDALKPYFGDVPAARRHFAAAQAKGLHITPNHFYSPIPDTRDLPPRLWSEASELPGIDMNETGQLELLTGAFASYTPAFAAFPRKKTDDELEFTFENNQLAGADPYVLYALVRELGPRRVVEVGSGFSTLVTARALRENGGGELVCVEPYPRPFVPRAVEGLGHLIRRPVQEVGLDLFTGLEAGDVLFIDSTHVVRIGGDVTRLFLEILPRLAPGVWVHVHDIFLPHDYPETWIKDMNFFWGEQYLLQALLIDNPRFRVRFAVGYMGRRHPELMARVFPHWALGMGGGSFWMRREEES